MAAESKWFTQKAGASAWIKQAVATGEKDMATLVAGLKEQGVSTKNAQKALHAEVMAGTIVMNGKWSDASSKFVKGGA